MKRVILVFASLLIGLTTASATESNTHKPNIKLEKRKSKHLSQPITFKENGVEFLIFSDGSFDFNAKHTKHFNPLPYNSNTYRNTSYRGPNANVLYTRFSNKGLTITHDRFGKIKRIGHVNINYDCYGRITRAGTVNMSYSPNKHAVLTKVGGLKVVYNRKGQIVKTRGQVKYYVKTRHNKKYKRYFF